jgi:hypothetical protein
MKMVRKRGEKREGGGEWQARSRALVRVHILQEEGVITSREGKLWHIMKQLRSCSEACNSTQERNTRESQQERYGESESKTVLGLHEESIHE